MVQSDEELYRQMRKGDQRAFAELYERREPALFRYALYLSGSRVVAEEVAHDAFIELIRRDTRFDVLRAGTGSSARASGANAAGRQTEAAHAVRRREGEVI